LTIAATLWPLLPTHTSSHEPIKVLDAYAHVIPVAFAWGTRPLAVAVALDNLQGVHIVKA
jgi:hypothetical protein